MNPTHDTPPRGRIARILSALAASARRTPAEVGTGLALALLFCMCLRGFESTLFDHTKMDHMQFFARVALSGVLFILASFALSMLHAIGTLSGKARAGLTAGVAVLVTGYGVFVLDLNAKAELWRWALLFGAGCMGVALTPLARRGDTLTLRARLWSFNARLVAACVSAGATLGLLYLGLALALLATDELLGVHVHHDNFAYLFGGIAFGLTPWAIASRLPHISAAAGPRAERTLDGAAAPYLNALVSALALPMTGLYTGILSIYNALFILGSADAPKNMMSPLALTASALAVGCAIAADELRRHDSTRGALSTRVSRWVVVAAGGLMPLTAWAILIRVDQYGWTSFRYVRMLAVLFVCLCGALAALHAWRGRTQPIAEMMLAAAASCVLGAAGPWGVVEVSKRAQIGRLVEAAQDHGRIHDGVLIPCSGACHINDHLREQLGYVIDEFGVDALTPMLPPDIELGDHTQAWWVMDALGWNNALKRIEPFADAPRGYAYRNNGRVDLPHGGTLFDLVRLNENAKEQDMEGLSISLTTFSDGDYIRVDARNCQLRGRVEPLSGIEREDMRLAPSARIELTNDGGETLGSFIPEHISQHHMGGRWRTDMISGRVLLERVDGTECLHAALDDTPSNGEARRTR